MKKLTIHHINDTDNLLQYAIDTAPWAKFQEKPLVYFIPAYDEGHLYLKYMVKEKSIIAKATQNNGAVWEDSCVEFFVMPNIQDGLYYNFEINCIGTKLLSVGTSRQHRIMATDTIIDKIIAQSTLGTQSFTEQIGVFEWSITIAIPFECFFKHKIHSMRGKTSRANFYKCGDGLTTRHYLSWNNIETPRPDFHTPQYFGEIKFS